METQIRYEISANDKYWKQIQELLSSVYMTSRASIAISRQGENFLNAYPGFLNEHLVCCAFQSEKLIGYLRATMEDFYTERTPERLAYISDLRVDPNYRRKSIAINLVENLMHALQERGIYKGFYYVNTGNKAQETMMAKVPDVHYQEGAHFITTSVLLPIRPLGRKPTRFFLIKNPKSFSPPWIENQRMKNLSIKADPIQWNNFIDRFPEIRFYASHDNPTKIAFALFNQGRFKKIKMDNYPEYIKLLQLIWRKLPKERVTWEMMDICFCNTNLTKEILQFSKHEAYADGCQILNYISEINGFRTISEGIGFSLANQIKTNMRIWTIDPEKIWNIKLDKPFLDLAFV